MVSRDNPIHHTHARATGLYPSPHTRSRESGLQDSAGGKQDRQVCMYVSTHICCFHLHRLSLTPHSIIKYVHAHLCMHVCSQACHLTCLGCCIVQIPIRNVQDGYMNSFRPPDSLSDDAVRKRAADAAIASPASVEPTWGPLVPEMNQAPMRPSRKGPGGPAWTPGDRRQLGGFDARFHSTSACAPTPSFRNTSMPIIKHTPMPLFFLLPCDAHALGWSATRSTLAYQSHSHCSC